MFVMVRAGIDIVSREATWEFQALDPATGTIIEHEVHRKIMAIYNVHQSCRRATC